jgi:formyl-CoA transferase
VQRAVTWWCCVTADTRPLRGLRVLELGQLVAGPFCGFMLAGFGADVIKVEQPGVGDPIRRWRKVVDGTSLWWRSIARDKRSITCDLRLAEGRDLVRRMVGTGIDIVIENFRPGRMESWGLGYEDLAACNPRVIMVRVSGYGQTGPHAQRPGFANVAEAFGGLRYVTGHTDRPPVRTGVSLGDSLAGLHAAYATLAAVHERDVVGSGRGQVVDCALYESVFNMMESLLPEYDHLRFVRERTGSRLPGIVPSNTYACADGSHVVVGANADALFVRLMHTIGRPDLADDTRLRRDDGRSAHADLIDEAIEAWTRTHTHDEVLEALAAAEIPSGPIMSIADIARDPHYAARGMFQSLPLPDGTPLRVPAVVPTLSRTPPTSHRLGPELGEHNDEVYGELLGLSEEDRRRLRDAGVI